MSFRPVFPDGLAAFLPVAQYADNDWAADKADNQGREHGPARAERDVPEHVKCGDLIGILGERVKEHDLPIKTPRLLDRPTAHRR